MAKKIFLDCTHTYNSGLNTGIQRVVKNLVHNIESVAYETKTSIIPVVAISSEFYTFETFATPNKKNSAIKLFLKNTYIKMRNFLASLLPSPLSRFLFNPNLTIFLNKLTDKALFYKKIPQEKKVIPRQGDTLLLIDTTWLYNDFKHLEALKKKGIKIVAVIYDIIPITHPEFCNIDLTLSLKEWYKKATLSIDGYIAISKSVKEELQTYLEKEHLLKKKVDYFYLGADFSTAYEEAKVPQVFKNFFANPNTYLTVSTIEPRKNHAYILDTFDLLWQSGEDVTYVMVGREGWNTKALMKRITSHPQYNKKLYLLTDTDDNALVYAYKHAKALLFASFVEGFGLPIIESLFYRLPVIASDTPIHREIGQQICSYFDLANPNSLADFLRGPQLKSVQDFPWQSWHESTKELILKSKEIA